MKATNEGRHTLNVMLPRYFTPHSPPAQGAGPPALGALRAALLWAHHGCTARHPHRDHVPMAAHFPLPPQPLVAIRHISTDCLFWALPYLVTICPGLSEPLFGAQPEVAHAIPLRGGTMSHSFLGLGNLVSIAQLRPAWFRQARVRLQAPSSQHRLEGPGPPHPSP